MDIVLEVLDTLLFDRIYATLLPASTATASFNAIKDAASAAAAAAANATFSSQREAPTHLGSYQYQAASQYFQLRPTEWAYMSAWARDNVYRQSLSIFVIGWCVVVLYRVAPRMRSTSCSFVRTPRNCR